MFNSLENWIPNSLVKEIDNIFSSDAVPWTYKPSTVNPEDVKELRYYFPEIKESHQFVHLLYNNREPVSPFWELARALIHFYEYHCSKEVVEIGRVKANMLFQDTTSKTTHNTPHVDEYEDGWTSIVYYVNDSDGSTVGFNKNLEKIDETIYSQGNAVYFPSNIMHASTNPKDSYRRIVINIVVRMKEIN